MTAHADNPPEAPKRGAIPVVKIDLYRSGGSLILRASAPEVAPFLVAADLSDWPSGDGELGQRVTLELGEMTEKELNELPEFDGW